jgi:hypothetical protein
MLTMRAAVAKMERDLLVARTQAGLARAMAKGKNPRKTAPSPIARTGRCVSVSSNAGMKAKPKPATLEAAFRSACIPMPFSWRPKTRYPQGQPKKNAAPPKGDAANISYLKKR